MSQLATIELGPCAITVDRARRELGGDGLGIEACPGAGVGERAVPVAAVVEA
jgi:hypothetical protein